MMQHFILRRAFLAVVFLGCGFTPAARGLEVAPYQPAPENLASRAWFQEARFGIFIHWGVYSVLGRGEWVLQQEKIPLDKYEPLTEQFNPVQFDADQWCRLFKQAGARYVTITSKHHDGFAMWDSKVSNWDIVERTPYGKDVLKQLAEACAKHDLKLFFYHSHLDWHHPEYFPRGMTGKTAGRPESGDFNKYLDDLDAQLTELLSGDYGQVAGIWFDGWWDQQTKDKTDPAQTTQVDWRLRQTYDLIHRLQPACMVGNNHHVAPFAGEDFQMFERDLPGQNKGGFSADAKIGDLPLETCDTINGAWGYNAGDKNVKTPRELVHYLVKAAGQGANLLLNIGPRPDGTIQPEFVERLEAIGGWLAKHGDTIYGTTAGPVAPQPWGVSTAKAKVVYLHLLTPPEPDDAGWRELAGAGAAPPTKWTLPTGATVETERTATGALRVKLPAESLDEMDTILVGE